MSEPCKEAVEAAEKMYDQGLRAKASIIQTAMEARDGRVDSMAEYLIDAAKRASVAMATLKDEDGEIDRLLRMVFYFSGSLCEAICKLRIESSPEDQSHTESLEPPQARKALSRLRVADAESQTQETPNG